MLNAGESALADKAYVANDLEDVLAPYKRKRGEVKLPLHKRDFNRVHRLLLTMLKSRFRM